METKDIKNVNQLLSATSQKIPPLPNNLVSQQAKDSNSSFITNTTMATIIQCPHFGAIGLSTFCLNGKFPVDCEKCDCKDKKYVEISSSNSASASLDTDTIVKTNYEDTKQSNQMVET